MKGEGDRYILLHLNTRHYVLLLCTTRKNIRPLHDLFTNRVMKEEEEKRLFVVSSAAKCEVKKVPPKDCHQLTKTTLPFEIAILIAPFS